MPRDHSSRVGGVSGLGLPIHGSPVSLCPMAPGVFFTVGAAPRKGGIGSDAPCTNITHRRKGGLARRGAHRRVTPGRAPGAPAIHHGR